MFQVSVIGPKGFRAITTVIAPDPATARAHALAAIRSRKGFASSVQLFATILSESEVRVMA